MADITEAKVYEALGLGVQAQEPADPAATQDPEVNTEPAGGNAGGAGAQAQEPAAPAQSDTNSQTGTQTDATAATADPEDPENNADTGADGGKQPLTAEQRRANAARRRQQEEDARVQKAVSEALQAERTKHDTDMKAFFEKAGIKDTFTGKPITSMEEFYAWRNKLDEAKIQKDLKEGKLTPEALEKAVAAHPVIKQAEQVVQKGQEAQRRAQEAEDKVRIEAQIAEISKIDPIVKSTADLLKIPEAKDLYAYIKKGYSIPDAHYLATRERRENARVEAVKQQAMNNARGKDHLQATGNARGTGAISVPAEEMKLYRMMNPGATEAQIQAHFNQYMKKQGG